MLIDTVLDDAVQVPIPSTLYQITGVNLYEADVATGAPPPATNSYALVGSFQPLTTATITASADWAVCSRGQHLRVRRQHRTRRRHWSSLCQHRLHQSQRKPESHRHCLHLSQRGCAGRPAVHGEYSHWTSQYHQPHHRIHGRGRHQRGSILLHSVSDGQREHPHDRNRDRRQHHHHRLLQLHRRVSGSGDLNRHDGPPALRAATGGRRRILLALESIASC